MKSKKILLATAATICALSSSLTHAAYSMVDKTCYSDPQTAMSVGPEEAQCYTDYLWVKPNAKFYVKAEAKVTRYDEKNWKDVGGHFSLYRRATGIDPVIFNRGFTGVYNYGTWINGSKTERYTIRLTSTGGRDNMWKRKRMYGMVYTND